MGSGTISHHLSIEELLSLSNSKVKVELTTDRIEIVKKCRTYLDQKIANSDNPIYGINTGFGSLYNRYISPSDLPKLQENLVKSHACGTGPEVSEEVVRLMMLLKIHGLAFGHSGVQWAVIERLLWFYNNEVYPLVYRFGSLGASGDLAPLAHLSLPLIGEGKVRLNGEEVPASKILERYKLAPIKLKPKDGLALLNGTQFMSGFGSWCVYNATKLIKLANIIGALSLDVFDGRIEPFDAQVHKVRPHPGQEKIAAEIRAYLEGSELIVMQKEHVQDPYSFRCIPQVHGASFDALLHVHGIVEREINSVTDNPIVFPDDDKIISAGNFHGQPLALGLDYLSIAMAEIGNISERRTYQLISGQRNLPHYLVANPGINSGLMIPQYTAANLVSYNKQLATPSSVDSIVSSNGQEDHVSMGASSAIRCHEIIQNVQRVLGIELLTAAQALNFKRPAKTSPQLENLVSNFRKKVTFIEEDRILHEDIVKAEIFLDEYWESIDKN